MAASELLDGEGAETLAGFVAHRVSHVCGPDVYYLYEQTRKAAHERLHEEVESLLPEAPDSSIWVYVFPDVTDGTFPCERHPRFAVLPERPESGRWCGAVRIHRHPDGTRGVEADPGFVCALLLTLTDFGGFVAVDVHGPRERMELGFPEAPSVASAAWRVKPVSASPPYDQRPTMLISVGGPQDEDPEDRLRLAVEAAPMPWSQTEEWRALVAALPGAPAALDTFEWRAEDAEGYLAALDRAVDLVARHPALAHPLASSAGSALLWLAAQSDDCGVEDGLQVAYAAASVLSEEGTSVRELATDAYPDSPIHAADLGHAVASGVAQVWHLHLSGTLYLPGKGPAAERDGLERLRALVARELSWTSLSYPMNR